MKKKIIIISILAVFMLVAISFASANAQTTKSVEKKESPLFRIRTRQANNENIDEIKENIEAQFMGKRIFFWPFEWIRTRKDPFMGQQFQNIKIRTYNWPPILCENQNNQGNLEVLNTRGGVCTYNKWCWDLS